MKHTLGERVEATEYKREPILSDTKHWLSLYANLFHRNWGTAVDNRKLISCLQEFMLYRGRQK